MPEVIDSRPLVMLVTRNFPPLLGGMEKLNWHLLSALLSVSRTALCGPSGCEVHVSTQTEVRQARVKPLPIFLLATFWNAVHLSVRKKPAWIIAGSGLTAPIAWLAAKCASSRTVAYLHGLDIVAPSRVYQWLWLPFIRHCDIVLANSASTARLAQQRGVHASRLHILHPGTDLPELDASAACSFREQHGLGQRQLLLSVGRLTQRKGLAEFVAKVLPAIVRECPETILAVVGVEAVDALHARSGSERERILSAAREAGVEQHLRFLGRCDDASLSLAYQAADLHVFPVLELPGDIEGFGMVALEAAAHGLPTVAFAVGGVPEAVQDKRTGTLVESGDYAGMATAAIQWLKRARGNDVSEACRAFATGKTWTAFGVRLRKVLDIEHV
jgi:phosphatidylinositol alpha-1,6-mannosyltransferase